MKEKDVVVPGEFLATEEEYASGINTFERDGKIFANSVGKPTFKNKEREVSVEKWKSVELLDKDTIVFGEVILVKNAEVIIELKKAEKNSSKRVIHQSIANLPIKNVSREYIKDLREWFKIGDIVKAKVSFVSSYLTDLRTNERELGVIKAFCSKCRSPLYLTGSNLKCLRCGNTEHRKFSSDYLLK